MDIEYLVHIRISLRIAMERFNLLGTIGELELESESELSKEFRSNSDLD